MGSSRSTGAGTTTHSVTIQIPGPGTMTCDGKDDGGQALSGHAFFCRLSDLTDESASTQP